MTNVLHRFKPDTSLIQVSKATAKPGFGQKSSVTLKSLDEDSHIATHEFIIIYNTSILVTYTWLSAIEEKCTSATSVLFFTRIKIYMHFRVYNPSYFANTVIVQSNKAILSDILASIL